jgi:hypothetical protein
MKMNSTVVSTILSFGLLLSSPAQTPEKKNFTPAADVAGEWEMKEDPKLPNVLILGDSISIGYTRDVRKELAGTANVYRPMAAGGNRPENCGDTEMGLAGIDRWLGDKKWSVIHFNWGLWDLCYRIPGKGKAGSRDKVNGKISISVEDYAANLEKLVTRMEATGAKLMWCATSDVPSGESGRVDGDEIKYNEAAAKVMERHHIPTDDLYKLTSGWAGKYSAGASDVHYKPAGSQLLGKQVAESIRASLK